MLIMTMTTTITMATVKSMNDDDDEDDVDNKTFDVDNFSMMITATVITLVITQNKTTMVATTTTTSNMMVTMIYKKAEYLIYALSFWKWSWFGVCSLNQFWGMLGGPLHTVHQPPSKTYRWNANDSRSGVHYFGIRTITFWFDACTAKHVYVCTKTIKNMSSSVFIGSSYQPYFYNSWSRIQISRQKRSHSHPFLTLQPALVCSAF